jgi:hypothetical protein
MDNCHFENITKLVGKKKKKKNFAAYFNMALPRYLCNIYPIATVVGHSGPISEPCTNG